MSGLTVDIVADVLAACTNGAAEAAEAIGRALDAEIASITPGEAAAFNKEALPDGLSGHGLAAVFFVEGVGAAFVLPKSAGLVPEWCDAPDPTGQSKLTTLAQELGMILLPETLLADDFKTGTIDDIPKAIELGQPADGAQIVPLVLQTKSGEESTAYLLWPFNAPAELLKAKAPAPPKPAAPPRPEPKPAAAARPARPASAPRPAAAAPTPQAGGSRIRFPRPAMMGTLPHYTKSILRIKVPVCVTLARQKQTVSDILSIGPGSIIQFDKSCEDMLDLEVGSLGIATGEAVKVGEKFGLRINEITLPKERFHEIRVSAKAAV